VEDFAAAHLTLRLIDREFGSEGIQMASEAAPAHGERRTRVRASFPAIQPSGSSLAAAAKKALRV